MEAERASGGMEILGKVDAVVTALSQAGELTGAGLAKAVGEPISSTYRLLSTLTRIGWVTPGSRRGLYRLGLFFMRVGGQVEDAIDIRERTLPFLQQLLDATGQTAYLCVQHDLRAVCIERLDGGDVRSLAMTLGATLPLVIGGAPKAILAFLPDGEYEEVVSRSMATHFAEGGPSSRKALQADVDRIRANGYSVSDGDVTIGVSAVGAPVFNHRGELAAAVSVSGIREHILGDDKRAAVIAEVRRCAAGVSRALGWHGQAVRR